VVLTSHAMGKSARMDCRAHRPSARAPRRTAEDTHTYCEQSRARTASSSCSLGLTLRRSECGDGVDEVVALAVLRGLSGSRGGMRAGERAKEVMMQAVRGS
jgi:hypothetical protein